MNYNGPIFQRPPRFLPDLPNDTVELPNPPSYVKKPEISWVVMLMPSGIMLIITVILALTSQSIYMMISIAATILTLITSLISASNQIKGYQKSKKNREVKYKELMTSIKNDLELKKQQQICAINIMNPSIEECVQRIETLDSRLWERTCSYDDFLSLRVGIGSAKSTVPLSYNKQGINLDDDALADVPKKLALEYEQIDNIPVCAHLWNEEILGVAGNRDSIINTINSMLLQLVTHHNYEDVKIILLLKDEERKQFDWLKWVPHIWSDDYKHRFMACGQIMTHQILSEIFEVLKERELKLGSNISRGDKLTLPYFVFIVSDSQMIENEAISKYLFNSHKTIGVSTIFLADMKEYLPMNCNAVITLQIKNGIYVNKEDNRAYTFIPDRTDFNILEKTSRKLAPVKLNRSGGDFALPKSISLFEMFKVNKPNEINLLERWENHKTYKGMGVPIGVKANGELFSLDMQAFEKSHGPHGLVAGTTGSGKSELLQSMIISLAINFHPHDVVFVLIDYKGGGMANIFEGMPHLVGTITNLAENETIRALLSIKSELKRRQEIFSKYKVNNIDKYQKMYHNKEADEPIPHLIMIADEFAELKTEQPDFMKELVSTARVGRSLGVHLILATQKPAGVVDEQIWSNSRFKICLKVQDEADSKDVIKRSDAAMIKEPGRAYIQVGNDEIFELFQSAWAGADYITEDVSMKSYQKKHLYKIDLMGRSEQIYPIDEDLFEVESKETQLDVMIDHIKAVSKKNGIKALNGPWPPSLKDNYYLDDIHNEVSFGFNEKDNKWEPRGKRIIAIIGMVDNPREQKQETLQLDFSNEGHLIVYGASGSGKTTLLQTLIMSLTHLYSPMDVHIYIMDFGGSSFKHFEDLPHCGGIMGIEEEKKINQFILFIFRIIEERKKIFEENHIGNYNGFLNEKNESLPAIFILIDNYFALSETYCEIDDQMIILAREGSKYGIYVVATATNSTLVKYKFSVNFQMSIALHMFDKSDYDAIVGRTEGLLPATLSGRGLIKNKPPLEFQTALPCNRSQTVIDQDFLVKEAMISESECRNRIKVLIKKYQAVKGIFNAKPIPVMPSNIDSLELYNSNIPSNKFLMPIGIGYNDFQTVNLDLNQNPTFMIVGDSESGKSTLLKSWATLLTNRCKEEELVIYVIDSNRIGLFELFKLSHVKSIQYEDDMIDFIDNIVCKIEERRLQMNECRKNNEDLRNVYESWQQIVFVIDDINEFIEKCEYNFRDLLERIINKEAGLKINVIVAGDCNLFASNWDSLAKAIKDKQCGVLLGCIKDQDLFNIRLPYGIVEKDFEKGDGYYISKNKYINMRYAHVIEQ